jgi:membrane fusion protein, copper/silver efflux system
MPTGIRNLVFVDKGEGRLEPRFIDLGRKYAKLGARYDSEFYEVRGGLKEGERVVTSANFLIDAESKIQGALKTWATEESAPEAPK